MLVTMLKKNVCYLIGNSKVKILENFLISFGTIWLLIEFPSAIFSTVRHFFEERNSWIFGGAITVSLLWGLYRAFPRMVFKRNFVSNTGTSVTLKVGNLFDEKNNIVVGSSDYFDTHYSGGAVNSLKTQMIKRFFNGKTDAVDQEISQSLQMQTKLVSELTPDKPSGNQRKYPVGTIATLAIDNQDRKLFLLVISKKSYNGGIRSIECNSTDLTNALDSLWERVRGEGKQRELSIPVLGTGLAGINLPRLFLLQTIILSYSGYCKTRGRVSDNLNIVIFDKDYNPGDFAEASRLLAKMQI